MVGSWTFDVPLFVGLVTVAMVYLWAAGPGRSVLGGPARYPLKEALAFFTALIVLGLAIMSPIGELSDRYLFLMHMVQHMLLAFVSAPLLLIGLPEWMVRPLAQLPGVYPLVRWLSKPLVAFVLFNGIFSGWHFPQFYDLALRNEIVHILEHQMMMGSAILLWMPTLSPLPELRASYPLQMIYYFMNSIVPTILGALITFSERVLYPTYELAPRIWGISALNDQKIGALIMWVPGGTIFLGVLTAIFFIWLKTEGQDDPAPVA